jgi:hypothetical protein
MESPLQDSRLKRSTGETRAERAMRDRHVTQDRELTEATRLEAFRKSLFQSALPDLPTQPGWHYCWLTTTNPRDPIHRRLTWGYELLKAAEVPGFESLAMKGGEFAGCVSVNEMIAAKIPDELYQQLMLEVHHYQPLQEEERLKANAELLQQQARDKGADILIEEGTAELGRVPVTPTFV